jgi:phosphate-selective porin OprO/OprP
LTGEERTSFSQAVVPVSAFDPEDGVFGTGAWELVGRVSRLEFDFDSPDGLTRVADPARSALGATEVTVGFNWYLNRWVRFQFNWEHARFGNPVRLGTGSNGFRRTQDSLLTAFQVVF